MSGKANGGTGNMKRHIEQDHPDKISAQNLEAAQGPFVR